jgi:hypothetical protein
VDRLSSKLTVLGPGRSTRTMRTSAGHSATLLDKPDRGGGFG